MTEAEWLSCEDPAKLLGSARRKKKLVTDRKLRLFAVACTRAVWELLTSENGRKAAEMAEGYADGAVTKKELDSAQLAAVRETVENEDITNLAEYKGNLALFSAVNASGDKSRLPYAAECARDAVSDLPAEQIRQCEMLRDILGNPFQRVHFDHSWQTSSAVAIVKQMYESRDFSAMPILADALEEAGCDNEAILNHCRDEGQVHVRGCWVVDGVLGKS